MMTRILMFLLFAVLPAMAQRGMRSPAFMSSITEVAVSGSPPDAPTDLSVGDAGTWTLGFTYDFDPNLANGFEMRRSVDGGGTTVVGGFPLGEVNTGDTPGDTHSYRYELRATNAFGVSSWVGPVYTVWTFNTAYYKLEEAASNARVAFVDTIGLGTLDETGGTVAQAAGKNNNASAFTSVAASYFTSANAIGTGVFDASFSISFWIYVTALPVGVNNQILVRQAASDIDLQLTTAGNLVWKPSGSFTGCSKALGSLNSWHFVVITFSTAPVASISVDGTAFVTDEAGGDPPADDDYLYVCSPFGMLIVANARVDELAAFNAALSAADVGVLYNSGTGLFR